MPQRRSFDAEFRESAVRYVAESGKPIAQCARDLGVNEGTLGHWVQQARKTKRRSTDRRHDERTELEQLIEDSGGLAQLRSRTSEPRWALEQELTALRERLSAVETELTSTQDALAAERASNRDVVEALLLQLGAAQQRLVELQGGESHDSAKKWFRHREQ